MKTKNARQKLVFSILTLLMICGTFMLCTERIDAAQKISSACAKAYAKKLNSLTKTAPAVKGYSFTIIRDMNHDGVPELLYNPKFSGSAQQPWTVYTYKKGKVKKMGMVSGKLYTISGNKKQYKFEAWVGVGARTAGYATFGKNKIAIKTESQYDGWPTNYYLKGKKTSEAKYNRYMKKFRKSMTAKRALKAIDTYKIKWDAKKVKSIVS